MAGPGLGGDPGGHGCPLKSWATLPGSRNQLRTPSADLLPRSRWRVPLSPRCPLPWTVPPQPPPSLFRFPVFCEHVGNHSSGHVSKDKVGESSRECVRGGQERRLLQAQAWGSWESGQDHGPRAGAAGHGLMPGPQLRTGSPGAVPASAAKSLAACCSLRPTSCWGHSAQQQKNDAGPESGHRSPDSCSR